MIFSPVNEWRAIAFASPHKITNVGHVQNIYFLRPTLFGALIKILPLKLSVKETLELKPFFIMMIDFSARFYFAQLFVLFSALSIIFFAHFQQKWLPIHWL